jgi:hypothetical protein
VAGGCAGHVGFANRNLFFLPVTAGDLLPSPGEPRCFGTRAGMTKDG